MRLQEKINEDIKIAMKLKEEVALRVLRQLKNAFTNAALLSGNASNELSDADVIVLIRKQIAQREDSIRQFTEGKRLDLALSEEAEMIILKQYLPEELSDDAVNSIVSQAITDVGALTKKDMGKAIKRAVELAKGGIDNKSLSEKIGKLLS